MFLVKKRTKQEFKQFKLPDTNRLRVQNVRFLYNTHHVSGFEKIVNQCACKFLNGFTRPWIFKHLKNCQYVNISKKTFCDEYV